MNRFFTSPANILESLANKKAPFREYSLPTKPEESEKRTPSLDKRSWTQSQAQSSSAVTFSSPLIMQEEKKESLPNSSMETEESRPPVKKQLPMADDGEKPIKKRSKKPIFSSAERVADVEQVLSLSKPEFLDSRNPFINKLMKISVAYKSKSGKTHQKTIFFGSKRKAYYITHKNEYLREASLHRIKGPSNFLEPKFYEMEILDGPSESLEENYLTLVKKFIS